MENQRFLRCMTPLALLFSLIVAACIQPIAAPPLASANNPVAVFDAFNAAFNAHDVDAALAFFAEDAVVRLPNQPSPNLFQGKAEIRNFIEGGVVQNSHMVTEDVQATVDTVTGTARVATDDLRPLGITLEGTVEVSVQQGKITSFTYTLSEKTVEDLMSAAESKPILAVFDLAADSAEQYDQIIQALEAADAGSPPGRLYHLAYVKDAGIVVADIWASGELLDQFAQTLVPVLQELGVTPAIPQIYPVHNILEATAAADLASAGENKPIFAVFEMAAESSEQYDQLIKDLEAAGAGSPQGRLYHVAYAKDGVITVADVWESGVLLDQFAQTLVPVLQEGGITPVQPQLYPVHNIIQQ